MPRDKHIARQLAKLAPEDAPGLQYLVVNRDAPVYAVSSGLADIKSKTPLSLDHTLSAFSMTKTLTALCILQLAERGDLGLEERVSDYVEHPYGRDITIRHLLTHTAGLPNPIPLKWVHGAETHEGFDERAALAKVMADHPKADRPPGEKYAYSNIGYWLLGQVIEAVAEQDYVDYVRRNIFQPLGLGPGEVDFVVTDNMRHAKGYLAKYSFLNLAKSLVTDRNAWGNYEGSWLHIRDVYVNGPSFGGAIGSAKAFGVILQDLLAERSVLLHNRSKELLYARQTTISGKPIDMTLGWHIGTLEGVEYFYKEGGGAGFHCEMRVYPTEGLGSVIMTNRTSFNTRKALGRLDKKFFPQQAR